MLASFCEAVLALLDDPNPQNVARYLAASRTIDDRRNEAGRLKRCFLSDGSVAERQHDA